MTHPLGQFGQTIIAAATRTHALRGPNQPAA